MTLSWRDVEVGCVVSQPGNAAEYKTGDWRADRPVYNFDRCIKCGICYIYCPDLAISFDAERRFLTINKNYCKNCGICMHECPRHAIVWAGGAN